MAMTKATGRSCPRVLVVDDEPMVHELCRDILPGSVDCELMFAASVQEAQAMLQREGIDLLVADIQLPDGNGLSLLPELARRQPSAAAMVITGKPSVEGAVSAFKGGAVDFLAKPFSAQQLAEHVRGALAMRQRRARREGRLGRLRDSLRQLNAARKIVNKKVDLLCNDLISAYGDVSRQLDLVRIQEGYQQFIAGAKDLEQLLCHTMDWLLRQVGYCNIGIWLTSSESELQLGAFMKYTIPADPELTEGLQKNLLRQALRRGFVHLHEAELKSALTPVEYKHLGNQDVVATNCSYLGESLGALLLFRDQKSPFKHEDVAAIKAMCPLFSLALTRAVRAAEGGEEEGHDEKHDEGPGPAKQKPGKGKKKHDPADWWKEGGESPF